MFASVVDGARAKITLLIQISRPVLVYSQALPFMLLMNGGVFLAKYPGIAKRHVLLVAATDFWTLYVI